MILASGAKGPGFKSRTSSSCLSRCFTVLKLEDERPSLETHPAMRVALRSRPTPADPGPRASASLPSNPSPGNLTAEVQAALERPNPQKQLRWVLRSGQLFSGWTLVFSGWSDWDCCFKCKNTHWLLKPLSKKSKKSDYVLKWYFGYIGLTKIDDT